jgi:hypothetical protein
MAGIGAEHCGHRYSNSFFDFSREIMKKHLCLLGTIVLLSLNGCATPYQASGLGGGYKEEQINANTYRISFYGNGYTKGPMVWNYWIYRCAELTRQKGYDVMLEIPDPAKNAKKTSSIDPVPKFVPTVAYGNDGAIMVKTRGGGGGGHTVYVPGGYSTITTYHSSGIIQMFHTSDSFDARAALRAQPILDVLKPYVDSAGKIAAPTRVEILKNALIVPPKPPGI